jgi:hypothetical protein
MEHTYYILIWSQTILGGVKTMIQVCGYAAQQAKALLRTLKEVSLELIT